MKTPICEMLGVDFPLVAFSHCRDVIAAVSRAGGFGVLSVTAFTPDQLEMELFAPSNRSAAFQYWPLVVS